MLSNKISTRRREPAQHNQQTLDCSELSKVAGIACFEDHAIKDSEEGVLRACEEGYLKIFEIESGAREKKVACTYINLGVELPSDMEPPM